MSTTWNSHCASSGLRKLLSSGMSLKAHKFEASESMRVLWERFQKPSYELLFSS